MKSVEVKRNCPTNACHLIGSDNLSIEFLKTNLLFKIKYKTLFLLSNTIDRFKYSIKIFIFFRFLSALLPYTAVDTQLCKTATAPVKSMML